MTPTHSASSALVPVWRRKWLILVIGILVAAGAYEHYKAKPTIFSVKTELYLGAASEGQQLLNTTLGKTKLSSTAIANDAELINTTIGEIVKKKFKREHKHDAAKGKVKAKAQASSEFIQLTAEAHTPTAVSEVANAYAQAYVQHHQTNYERNVRSAIATTTSQIQRIERAVLAAAARVKASGKSAGGNSSASTLQTASLKTKLNQLESDLLVKGVEQVSMARPAKAELIGPKPKQNGIFGFVIGVLLSSMAVFLISRVNPRVRALSDVEGIFGLPVLAAMPVARTPIVRRDGQVRPSKLLSEPLWRLQTSLRLGANGEDGATPRPPKSILFLSADPGDGKSTIAAGLALVQRDAGERTTLVEADFRRPTQARLLNLGYENPAGLADVLAGSALPSVGAADSNGASGDPGGGVATVLATPGGSVTVLRGGAQVANPPALLARPEMVELLQMLGADFDNVLVDAPPPLQVSDVMPLLNAVDGIVIVARIDHTRETSARRLMQLLDRTVSAPVLGVVANAVRGRDIERYGFSSGTGNRRWPLSLLGR
jgi:polysaccharide biosynthesis transport protein